MTVIIVGKRLQEQVPADDYSLPFAGIQHSGGRGEMIAVGATSTNGTLIGEKPLGAVGIRIYCNAGDSVRFTVASAAPSAPPPTFLIDGPAAWDEGLIGPQTIYVTAKTGTPSYRWY